MWRIEPEQFYLGIVIKSPFNKYLGMAGVTGYSVTDFKKFKIVDEIYEGLVEILSPVWTEEILQGFLNQMGRTEFPDGTVILDNEEFSFYGYNELDVDVARKAIVDLMEYLGESGKTFTYKNTKFTFVYKLEVW